jgi:outer membrane protein assembly factor BamB
MNDNSPIVDNEGYIYIGTDLSGFLKFDQDLTLVSSYNTGGSNFNAGSAIISQNKYIYLNDFNNINLICIDKTLNNVYWTINYALIGCYSTPCIGKNGEIYIATQEGIKSYI